MPRPASQPNILFILIDDLGWRDLTCYGSSFYETPHLDRLAREGMLFTDAYATSPVCSPARASVMTGRYPARVGITQYIGGNGCGRLCDVPYLRELPVSETTIATMLRGAGYQTWHVGKWHLGGPGHGPQDHGFEVNVGGCDWGMPAKGYWSPWGMPTLPDGPRGEYLTDALTGHAVDLLQRRDRARPFFLDYWAYAVHTPIQSPPALVAKYEQKARDLGLDRLQALIPGERNPRYFQAKRGWRVKRRVLQSDAAYAAMVENLDTNLGRVFAALAETGAADNTLVVFTSDNGGLATAEGSPTCNLPLKEGKGWCYEGGTRVCGLARWPGRIAPGARCAVPITGCDFFPTMLQAAGLPLRPDLHRDGESLLPLFAGRDDALHRDAIFWHYPHYSNQGGAPACSVRVGDWKLIEFFEDGHRELYHLPTDIEELHDRGADAPDQARELADRLREWRLGIEALVPRPNPRYAAQAAAFPPLED